MTINNDNWTVVKHNVEIAKSLRAVHFVNSMTGWAAGDSGAVYATTDGGRVWKQQSPDSDADMNFIYFIDLNRGWMLGKSGVKTGDENEGENTLFITVRRRAHVGTQTAAECDQPPFHQRQNRLGRRQEFHAAENDRRRP